MRESQRKFQSCPVFFEGGARSAPERPREDPPFSSCLRCLNGILQQEENGCERTVPNINMITAIGREVKKGGTTSWSNLECHEGSTSPSPSSLPIVHLHKRFQRGVHQCRVPSMKRPDLKMTGWPGGQLKSWSRTRFPAPCTGLGWSAPHLFLDTSY